MNATRAEKQNHSFTATPGARSGTNTNADVRRDEKNRPRYLETLETRGRAGGILTWRTAETGNTQPNDSSHAEFHQTFINRKLLSSWKHF